jgi:hypothetical protein
MKKLMIIFAAVFFLSAGMAYAESDNYQDSTSETPDSTYSVDPSSGTYQDVDPAPYLDREPTPKEQEKENYMDNIKEYVDEKWS